MVLNRKGVFSNKGEIIPKTQGKQVMKHLKFSVFFSPKGMIFMEVVEFVIGC